MGEPFTIVHHELPVTYNNRLGNTQHLARVQMKKDESLRNYTNHFFENRNQLASAKDKDVIIYYEKGVTNLKLFKKDP
jgi:hypothetical protein